MANTGLWGLQEFLHFVLYDGWEISANLFNTMATHTAWMAFALLRMVRSKQHVQKPRRQTTVFTPKVSNCIHSTSS